MDGTLLSPVEPVGEAEHDTERLLELLYLCPHGLAELDAAGRILLVNPACLQLLLRAAGAVPNLANLFDLLVPFLPDLPTRVRNDRRRRGMLLDGVRVHVGPVSGELAGEASGRKEPFVLSLTLLRIAPDRLMAVLSDVSQQVAQERRLRDAEAWFNAVMQADQAYASVKLDRAGMITHWDRTAASMFRAEASDMIGRPAGALLFGQEVGLTDRLAHARRDGWHVASEWLPRGGDDRFWATSVLAVLDDDARDPGSDAFLVVVRDGTEQRCSVEALRDALSLDHLTGVLNRRSFHEAAEAACERALRAGEPLSLVMVDADHFKRVNDGWGHAAGDAVLTALARVLKDGTRVGHDLIGRLGGEEFAIVLPGMAVPQASSLAERLRAQVEALAIQAPGSESTLRLTASFGVASLQGGCDLGALLRASDGALYAAKTAGRNRVALGAAA